MNKQLGPNTTRIPNHPLCDHDAFCGGTTRATTWWYRCTLAVLGSSIFCLVARAQETPAEPRIKPAREVHFTNDVQPILAKRCYACHGPDVAESGLSFVNRESALSETESGDHAIVPGDIDASLLIARVISTDENERMPPEGDPLKESEVEILRNWINAGAKWQKHWAFEPLSHPQPPEATSVDEHADAVPQNNPIDAFIQASLATNGLVANPPADRRTLIRRAYFDLIGLPPSAEEITAFVNDTSHDAFEQLIDRLLAMPQYGERFGRHWLDLVRYGETNSFERDNPKPNVWKYRDYVIRSFNEDKPYDQFVREQLAGDELDNVTTETLTATGYYRLGIWDDEPADPLQARFDELDDILATTSQVFLGLTINCARCHDHKIDPIPQTDYYSMLAFMADLTPYGNRGDQSSFNQIDISTPELNRQYDELDAQHRQAEQERTAIEQTGIEKMSAEDQRATEGPKRERERVLKKNLKQHLDDAQIARHEKLQDELKEIDSRRKTLPTREAVLGLGRYEPLKPTFVLFRGNPHSPTDEVQPDYPTLFDIEPPELESRDTSRGSAGRRRVLADWMTQSDNRLTSRVMVNRVWQYHFGRGIVRSSNNFGQLGTPPTHPELLDWLATFFVENGWRLKDLHRQIMTSRAYQMTSANTDEGLAVDPNNDFFWRFDPRRLSAEEVRDAVLAVNGSINKATYGPSFFPKLSAEVLSGQSRPGAGWGDSSEDECNRRSVYIHVKRSLVTPLLEAFDFPEPDRSCEARFMTLQPGQALSMLNSDFIHEQAAKLAKSIDAKSVSDDEVAKRAIRAVFARDATDEEVGRAVKLIADLEGNYSLSRERAVQLYCLTILNWNEFLFLD